MLREAVERITGSRVVAERPAAAGGYTNEHAVYDAINGPFMPELVGWEDGILVLEDLSAAHWPPPWSPGHVDAVHAALAELHALAPPPNARRWKATASSTWTSAATTRASQTAAASSWTGTTRRVATRISITPPWAARELGLSRPRPR